jgi:hypothetical protein
MSNSLRYPTTDIARHEVQLYIEANVANGVRDNEPEIKPHGKEGNCRI